MPAGATTNFRQAIQSGFANYTKFSGRTSVMEFWYWVLFTIICTAVTGILDAVLFPSLTLVSPFSDTFAVATLLPSLAVSMRRLHDTGRSGWWMLLFLVPLIGALVLIVWWVGQGSAGDNKYGADPSHSGAAVGQNPAA